MMIVESIAIAEYFEKFSHLTLQLSSIGLLNLAESFRLSMEQVKHGTGSIFCRAK